MIKKGGEERGGSILCCRFRFCYLDEERDKMDGRMGWDWSERICLGLQTL